MDPVVIIGYLLSLLIGISLGLIGGGGSILTVPILVYVLSVKPELATAYSLFIVGGTALVGSFEYMRKQLLSYKTAIVFGIPSIIAVYATRKFLVPAIPEEIFVIGSLVVTKDLAIMVFFAIIMLLASYSMIRGGKKEDTSSGELSFNYPMILLEGAVVGTITGIVGAGGGFLIIPALVLLAKLPMKLAVGTSLLIIAAKSLLGFLGDVGQQPIDWTFLLIFTAIAIAGILIGSFLSNRIQGSHLKKGFGWFVLLMGVYIFVKELFL